MICGSCGAENTDGARFCEACGSSFAPKPKLCRACGVSNRATALFCSMCGVAFDQVAIDISAPAKVGTDGRRVASPTPSETPLSPPPIAAPAQPPIEPPTEPTHTASPPPTPEIPPSVPLPSPPPQGRRWLRLDRTSAIFVILLAVFGLYLAIAPSGGDGVSEDPVARVLGLFAGAWAIGGALAAAALLDRPKVRFGVAAGIGVAAALLYNSVPVRPVTGALLTDLVLAAGSCAVVAALATWFFREWTWIFDGPAIYRWLQRLLLPRNWPNGPQPDQLGSKQLVTRWFVAIAAATGSVVGALAAQPRFWDAALEALSPKHILFTLLLMIVSITLIGPLEEYIFGRQLARPGAAGHAAEPGSARGLIEDVWQNFSPRAAGRLALVFLFSLQPTLLDACVGEAIKRGDAQVTFVLLTSAIGPAFTTYYWGAALQGQVDSVARQAGKSTTYFSAFLYFPFTAAALGLLMFRLLFSNGESGGGAAIIFGPLIALGLAAVVAVVVGFLIDGISAYIGGWALDFGRGRLYLAPWQIVGALGGVLVVGKLAVLVLFTMTFLILGRGGIFSASDFVVPVLSMAGWAAGLLVSGFPQILHSARARALPSAAYKPSASGSAAGG